MLELFNQYSAFITIPGIIVLMIALLPIKGKRRQIVIYSIAGIIGLSAVLILRPGDSSVATEAEAQTVITSGSPVFVEFFSNSCTACLASQPIVQSLEGEMDEDVQFLKLNVQDSIASQLVRDYRAYLTPTFVVIGRDGEIVWRQSGGLLDKAEALEALAGA
ncbi:MAG: thioredoxin family protein [Chloroflexi bacterium]|nr:thioredoxin family protein [Chloroflexota bacterium]MBT5628324.1 thioredoxin family protein [Chloroflexota bacterium]